MPEDEKRGTIWQSDELDAIVADYFAMLSDELSGTPYVKSHHSADLMARIGRSHRSVEVKHQNISAVLDELGMPWIPGYRPKPNYQNAIFDAIDRYLSGHRAILEPSPKQLVVAEDDGEVFVPVPEVVPRAKPAPKRLRQLVAKFDPVEQDHRNRSLGRAGEAFVVDLERRRLAEEFRPDLARKVRWTAVEDGDGAGYDVFSFHRGGGERLIEVKTTNGSARTPFFLTRNECEVARERAADWMIYRVHFFASGPRIFTLLPPLESSLRLTPETWRATF
jgi:hypothetical protein